MKTCSYNAHHTFLGNKPLSIAMECGSHGTKVSPLDQEKISRLQLAVIAVDLSGTPEKLPIC